MKSSLAVAALIATAISTMSGAQAAEIRVLSTGAARSAYEELAQQFERATGHKLVTHFGLPAELVKKIEAGEPFDVVILSYDVEPLIRQAKVVANSRTVFGRTGVGVAIPQGAPQARLQHGRRVQARLLNAKSIATSGEGSSGRYVITLLDRLGIADQVKPKIKSGPRAPRRNWLRSVRWTLP